MFIKPVPCQDLLTGCSVDDFMFYHALQVIWSPQCRQNLTHARIFAFIRTRCRTEKERNKSPLETTCLLLHLLCAGRDVTLTVIVSLVSLL